MRALGPRSSNNHLFRCPVLPRFLVKEYVSAFGFAGLGQKKALA
jgi:hypothetical protein